MTRIRRDTIFRLTFGEGIQRLRAFPFGQAVPSTGRRPRTHASCAIGSVRN